MKGITVLAIMMTGMIFSPPSFSAAPCKVLICMYGKATGSKGGSECKSAEKAFFSIVKKKKGRFNPGETFDARESFLGSCPNADLNDISVVMKKFGKINGGF